MKSFIRNNFKLSFDKTQIKFFVNEKKRTVTCTIVAELLTPFDTWNTIPNTYINGVGVAKCCEEDTFDVERGKRIAMAKAENNAYKKSVNYLEPFTKELLNTIYEIGTYAEKAGEYLAHNEDYIESVSNPEHQFYKTELKKVPCGVTVFN